MNAWRIVKPLLLAAAVIVLAALVVVYAGVFSAAADDPHWGATRQLLETARERSIAMRARSIETPSLDDPKLIARGAEEYAEMCTECHLAPGMKETPLRAGLYPQPPDLTAHAALRTPAENFWIIKHGLKMTGMPAWGLTHGDDSIWAMVAFMQRLPELSPDEYQRLVHEAGGAHSHGEGSAHSHGEAPAASPPPAVPEQKVHRHKDGSTHVH